MPLSGQNYLDVYEPNARNLDVAPQSSRKSCQLLKAKTRDTKLDYAGILSETFATYGLLFPQQICPGRQKEAQITNIWSH